MRKVFGVGWAKTGTKTLGRCLEILGFDHQSQRLDLVKDLASGDLSTILALAAEKDSFEDWPWAILYRELDEAFPGSRFILTKRTSTTWLRSYRNMLRQHGEATQELNEIRRTIYGLPFPLISDHQLIKRYERHNADVMDHFRDGRNSLLVVDWESGQGWNELCRFLGKEIPDQPFPHLNPGKYAPTWAHPGR